MHRHRLRSRLRLLAVKASNPQGLLRRPSSELPRLGHRALAVGLELVGVFRGFRAGGEHRFRSDAPASPRGYLLLRDARVGVLALGMHWYRGSKVFDLRRASRMGRLDRNVGHGNAHGDGDSNHNRSGLSGGHAKEAGSRADDYVACAGLFSLLLHAQLVHGSVERGKQVGAGSHRRNRVPVAGKDRP